MPYGSIGILFLFHWILNNIFVDNYLNEILTSTWKPRLKCNSSFPLNSVFWMPMAVFKTISDSIWHNTKVRYIYIDPLFQKSVLYIFWIQMNSNSFIICSNRYFLFLWTWYIFTIFYYIAFEVTLHLGAI